MHYKAPTESFLGKATKLVHQGVGVMSTLKGAYDLGRGLYTGIQAARAVAPLAMAALI